MSRIIRYEPVTIANGANLSSAVNFNLFQDDIKGMRLFAIVMPSSWTTANLTFQASHDGSTYNNVYDQNGTELVVTAAASRFIYLDPTIFPAIQWLKVRSGTSSSPVNQGGNRVLTLVLRNI